MVFLSKVICVTSRVQTMSTFFKTQRRSSRKSLKQVLHERRFHRMRVSPGREAGGGLKPIANVRQRIHHPVSPGREAGGGLKRRVPHRIVGKTMFPLAARPGA